MVRDTVQALVVHTYRSTTPGEARGSSGRMDKGCPCPFRVRILTQILFHVPCLFLAAYSSLLLQFCYPFLYFFQILLQRLHDR
jgi:hypothetical protein